MNDSFRSAGDARAEQLLSGYCDEAPFFFATPEHTLLAQGRHAVVPRAENLADLSQVVDAALKKARSDGQVDPVVVGAIPFDARQPACLFIPRQVMRAGPLGPDPLQTDARSVVRSDIRTGTYSITPNPAPQVYADGVAEAVRRIKENVLDKVVLARTLELAADERIDVQHLIRRLARHNRHGYTFAADLAGTGDGTLIGASPELLASRRGMQIRSNPLAGSAARSQDREEDMRRSRALLLSAKDLNEHRVVAEAVAEGLRPYCRTLDAPARPSLISTETMWHLSSDIRGVLADPDVSSLRLAASLHPTPAVCGYPSATAFDLIGRLEPFGRGFYSGMVGWCDADGNGEWVVTLRCAKVSGNTMRLFAGAGVVAESDPQSELAETAAKFRTMLNALGLVPEGAV
jgi:isochorismate synthase